MTPKKDETGRLSRRDALRAGAAALAGGAATMAFGSSTSALAYALQRTKAKIKDVQTMMLQGGRTYTLVRIVADNGVYGIGEAYGSPGVSVADQILSIKPRLVGKSPHDIDVIYTNLDRGAPSLSGTRTDGSAHNLLRAASGIDMALWDLSGKLLGAPISDLFGGRFRERVRMYRSTSPANPWDKASCREWAQMIKEHPSGFTASKVGVFRTSSIWTTPPAEQAGRGGAPAPAGRGGGAGPAGAAAPAAAGRAGGRAAPYLDATKDTGNRHLTTMELVRIGQAFENMREAVGWEHDIMCHCHWEMDLASAIQLARVLEPVKPFFLEDPLMVDYSESWDRLMEASPVTIMMGENLARREGFRPFIVNQACHIINPDLRNSGGFLETKRIADLGSLYGISMCTHNTASQVHTYQVAQWATSIRDYLMGETVTGGGGFMDEVVKVDTPYIEKGYIKANDRPGTGVELNKEVVVAHLAQGAQWWGDL
jgi:L-alanine-DL-glutamate epimerase-like enolase superfamily enzyme